MTILLSNATDLRAQHLDTSGLPPSVASLVLSLHFFWILKYHFIPYVQLMCWYTVPLPESHSADLLLHDSGSQLPGCPLVTFLLGFWALIMSWTGCSIWITLTSSPKGKWPLLEPSQWAVHLVTSSGKSKPSVLLYWTESFEWQEEKMSYRHIPFSRCQDWAQKI